MIDKEDKRPGTTHITKKYLKEKMMTMDKAIDSFALYHIRICPLIIFFSLLAGVHRVAIRSIAFQGFFFKTFHSQLSFYRSVITECKSTERQKTTSHGLLLHYGNSFTSAVNDDLGHMPKIYLLF